MTETILATLVAEAFVKQTDLIHTDPIHAKLMADIVVKRLYSKEGISGFYPSFYAPIKEWLCENAPTYGVSDILPDDVAVAFRLTFL